MPRLFTGVEIPADVGQALATLRGGLPGARWIDPENYHLTLRFIGDVDDDIAHEVASLLGRVKRGPFELHMDGLTFFGGHGAADAPSWPPEASVLVLGVAEGDATDLGRRYRQNAIVAGVKGQEARLVWCGIRPVNRSMTADN